MPSNSRGLQFGPIRTDGPHKYSNSQSLILTKMYKCKHTHTHTFTTHCKYPLKIWHGSKKQNKKIVSTFPLLITSLRFTATRSLEYEPIPNKFELKQPLGWNSSRKWRLSRISTCWWQTCFLFAFSLFICEMKKHKVFSFNIKRRLACIQVRKTLANTVVWLVCSQLPPLRTHKS